MEHRWSGAVIRSSLQPSQHESHVLATHGDRIRIFRLRGFVFFGTADRVYRELLACAHSLEGATWVVVDFGSVTGMDSSAAAAFAKLARNVDADRVRFMVCGMTPQVARRWNASLETLVAPLAFENRDLALEFCEAQLLQLFSEYAKEAAGLESWLTARCGSTLARLICERVERIELVTGDVLCAQGERADQMFFLHSGRLAVLIDDCRIRICSMGAHTTIGEMGLYRNMPRDATVVAEMPALVYALSREALGTIEAADPRAAMAFHSEIVRSLAYRIDHQNEVIASITA